MKIKHYALIPLTALVFSWNDPAYCKEDSADPTKILITIKNSGEFKSECESVQKSLVTLIKSDQRFLPKTSGQAPNTLEIRCTKDTLSGRFTVSGTGNRQLLAASYSLPFLDSDLFDDPVTAKNFWNKLLDRLPWSGEVIGLSKAESKNEKASKELPLRAKGFITMGSSSNSLLGNCVPIEVGLPNGGKKQESAEFQPVVTGLLREIGAQQSHVEIYSKDEKFDIHKIYISRLADPSQLPPGMANVIKDCQTIPVNSSASGLQSMLGNVFGKDPVEVNDIQQRYGLALINMKGGNGEKAYPMIGAFLHNRLLFGQYIFIDAFGVRSIYSKPYQQLSTTSATPAPELTIFELFAGGRGKYKKINLLYGLGLVLEKPNIPYVAPNNDSNGEVNVSSRVSSARWGMLLGGNYVSDRITYGLRIPYGQSNSRTYIDLHAYGSYRLSSTWLTGMDFMVLHSQAKDPNAPDADVFAAGVFLGIEVGR